MQTVHEPITTASPPDTAAHANRRAILTQLATAAVVATPGAAIATEPADPFPELERRFWYYYRWEGLPKGMEDDDPG
jgi:hypothetical protein